MISLTEIVENTIGLHKSRRNSEKVKEKYTDHVPIYVKYYDNDRIYLYLPHRTIPFMDFMYIIRKRRSIGPETQLVLLIECERDPKSGRVGAVQATMSQTMGELADQYMHEDGFLYVNVATESTFG